MGRMCPRSPRPERRPPSRPNLTKVCRSNLRSSLFSFYIGDWHDAVDRRVVNFLHITHILSIAGVANYVHYKRLIPQHVKLMMFCIEDTAEVSLHPMLDMACNFIAKGRAAGGVLVHCVAGISRSASFCIAYMLRDLGYTYEHALRVLCDARPVCCPNPGFAKQLLEFEQETHLITFTVSYNSSWGQVLYIVGETELLGKWRPATHNKMTWKSSGSWQIQLPVFGKKFQYKYIVVNISSNTELEDPSSIEDSSIIWESCPNRVYEKGKAVFDVWNKLQA